MGLGKINFDGKPAMLWKWLRDNSLAFLSISVERRADICYNENIPASTGNEILYADLYEKRL